MMVTDENKKDKIESLSQDEVARHRLRILDRLGLNDSEDNVVDKIVLPRGFTILIHGTDTARWETGQQVVEIIPGGIGLSCITLEERERAQQSADNLRKQGIATGGYDTTRNYATPRDGSATPVEVRVLFYQESLSPRFRTPDSLKGVTDALSEDKKKKIGRYFPPRHAVVPPKTELILLGSDMDQDTGRLIEYFVPNDFADEYADAVEQEPFLRSYERKKSLFETNLESAQKRLDTARSKLEDKMKYLSIKERAIGVAQLGVKTRERVVSMWQDRLHFLRPSSEADKSYRMSVYTDLPRLIGEVVPKDSVRFHGSALSASRDIIASGEISSSVDRLGFETSYDTSGQISVTSPESVRVSVEGYMDMIADDFNTPPGCLFVLESPDPTTENTAAMLMGNVNFKENPDLLRFIMASKESLPLVQEWASQAGIDQGKVVEYFEFVKLANSRLR